MHTNRWFVFAALSAPLLAAASAATGCGSTSESSQGAGADGGTDGSGGTSGNEGGLGSSRSDAGPDATSGGTSDDAASGDDGGRATVEAGPGLVTVLVATVTGPEEGIQVVFHNPDGSVLATGTTDSTGQASHQVPVDAMVTAAFGAALSSSLVTVTGVSGGDVIHLLDTATPMPAQQKVNLTYPPSNPAGTTYYFLSSPCTSGAFILSLERDPLECAVDGPFPVLLLALSGAFDNPGQRLGFQYAKGISLPEDGGASALAFTGTWQPTGTLHVSLSNVPSPVGSLLVTYTEEANGFPFSFQQGASSDTAPTVDAGTMSTWTYDTDPGFPDYTQTEVMTTDVAVENPVGPTATSYALLATRSNAAPTIQSFDLSKRLAAISGAQVDTMGSQTSVVSWTPAASLGSADGTYVHVAYGTYSWTVVVPPGAAQIALPSLPSSLAAWAPAPGAKFHLIDVATVDVSTVEAYAELRQAGTAFMASPCAECGGVAPMLPEGAAYTLTGYWSE